MWFSLIIEFGFQFSASRELAKNRENQDKISELVAGVHGAKIILILISSIGALIAFIFIRKFNENSLFLIGAWLLTIAQGINPLWFFQGIEKLRLPSIANVMGRAGSVIGIFILIHSPDDAWKVLFIQSICLVTAFGFCIFIIYRKVKVLVPAMNDILETMKVGWSMFLFKASVSLYTAANSFILGLFVPAAVISYYGSAEKINRAALMTLNPVSQALYPRINNLIVHNQDKARKVVKISLAGFTIFGLILGLCIFLIAPLAIRIVLGPGYEEAVPVLRIFAFLIPLVAISNVLGIQWMLPNQMDAVFNKIIISAGLINIILAVILAPLLQAKGMAIAVVCSEIFVTAMMFLILFRKRKWM